ncbi:HEPN domain-containing protein [Sediminibacterium salmoneum]|uniref:HEPN domain-containing protein n=1 Tax=Sediminibacterium salmoneum TaxID=426421 RepID=UPI00047E7FE0|nr:HEPN domain-containing protein [Sediminibacterium salmoneum]
MNSTSLKRKFKERKLYFAENNTIRIHRAISWLESANYVNENDDLSFISLWISFNACYAVQMPKDEILSAKENFRVFLKKLVKLDTEKRFYNLLWNQFSGPVRLLINNQYIFRPFWDFQRGEIIDWKKQFDQSVEESMKYLSNRKVVDLLEVVLDRLYTLRNQLVHGGATYKSEVNRAQVIDGKNILNMLVPLIIEIMMDNEFEDWGEIYYPVI